MTIIRVRCIDQVLTFESTPTITSGGLGEDFVNFQFCSKWDGTAKTAVFWRTPEDAYHAVLDLDGTCAVPHEVLADEGVFYFGVYGVYSDGRRRTSEVQRYLVGKGVITEATEPSDPTPDMYTQLLAQYAEALDELARAEAVAVEAAQAAQAAQQAAESAGTAAESIASVAANAETKAKAAETKAQAAETAAQNAVTTANAAKATADNHTHTAADVGASPAYFGTVNNADLLAWAKAQKASVCAFCDTSVTTINLPVSASGFVHVFVPNYGGGATVMYFAPYYNKAYFNTLYSTAWKGWVETATTDYVLPRDGSAAMTGALTTTQVSLIPGNGGTTQLIPYADRAYFRTYTSNWKTRRDLLLWSREGNGDLKTALRLLDVVEGKETPYDILHTGNAVALGFGGITTWTYEGNRSNTVEIPVPVGTKLLMIECNRIGSDAGTGGAVATIINSCFIRPGHTVGYAVYVDGDVPADSDVNEIPMDVSTFTVSFENNKFVLTGVVGDFVLNLSGHEYTCIAFT